MQCFSVYNFKIWLQDSFIRVCVFPAPQKAASIRMSSALHHVNLWPKIQKGSRQS